MLWVKSLHIIFMVTWFAGLFYLPRLFVYHTMASDTVSLERFKVMERKLYWGIMTPGAGLTIVFGLWLWLQWFRPATGWLEGSGLRLENGVAVDAGLRASRAGVYAVGDCAAFESRRFTR